MSRLGPRRLFSFFLLAIWLGQVTQGQTIKPPLRLKAPVCEVPGWHTIAQLQLPLNADAKPDLLFLLEQGPAGPIDTTLNADSAHVLVTYLAQPKGGYALEDVATKLLKPDSGAARPYKIKLSASNRSGFKIEQFFKYQSGDTLIEEVIAHSFFDQNCLMLGQSLSTAERKQERQLRSNPGLALAPTYVHINVETRKIQIGDKLFPSLYPNPPSLSETQLRGSFAVQIDTSVTGLPKIFEGRAPMLAYAPAGWRRFKTLQGDLNKDQKPDQVIIWQQFHPQNLGDSGRILAIYLADSANQWVLATATRQLLASSLQGKRFGDPLEEIYIRNGVLVIHQVSGGGGPGWHTDYSSFHRFRYQKGNFYLIGFTFNANRYYSDEGESNISVDANLSTGIEVRDGKQVRQPQLKLTLMDEVNNNSDCNLVGPY